MVTVRHDIATTRESIFKLLESVPDPEIPVISILDLGIVRDVKVDDGKVEIFITPTYSGCPAMDAISMDIRLKLFENGLRDFTITSVLSPAWTTEWMSDAAKAKLKRYGIAPPSGTNEKETISCPQCHSEDTVLLSQFGSTACKALYQCNTCKEPFDYFKCH